MLLVNYTIIPHISLNITYLIIAAFTPPPVSAYPVFQLAQDEFMQLLSNLEQEQAESHQPKEHPPHRGGEGVPVEHLGARVRQQDGPALCGWEGGR